jgi:hypothetical protein
VKTEGGVVERSEENEGGEVERGEENEKEKSCGRESWRE